MEAVLESELVMAGPTNGFRERGLPHGHDGEAGLIMGLLSIAVASVEPGPAGAAGFSHRVPCRPMMLAKQGSRG